MNFVRHTYMYCILISSAVVFEVVVSLKNFNGS